LIKYIKNSPKIRLKGVLKMNRIKELRKESGLSQEELATKLNLPRSTYYTYESGQRKICADLLIDLAKYYNTSVDYILGLTKTRISYNDIIGIIVSSDEIIKVEKE